MKRILLLLLLASVGCATTSPYTGPVSDSPRVSISYLRHFVPDPYPRFASSHLETIATAHVVNPSSHAMRLQLDCTTSLHTLDVPARTVSHVLLDPTDTECVLR